ncbi:hypothetical protein M758_3G229900 [Ceratodon purpureus]|nr:hypothetical protein M758_3G229900 [Ceratodon purpureus]
MVIMSAEAIGLKMLCYMRSVTSNRVLELITLQKSVHLSQQAVWLSTRISRQGYGEMIPAKWNFGTLTKQQKMKHGVGASDCLLDLSSTRLLVGLQYSDSVPLMAVNALVKGLAFQGGLFERST